MNPLAPSDPPNPQAPSGSPNPQAPSDSPNQQAPGGRLCELPPALLGGILPLVLDYYSRKLLSLAGLGPLTRALDRALDLELDDGTVPTPIDKLIPKLSRKLSNVTYRDDNRLYSICVDRELPNCTAKDIIWGLPIRVTFGPGGDIEFRDALRWGGVPLALEFIRRATGYGPEALRDVLPTIISAVGGAPRDPDLGDHPPEDMKGANKIYEAAEECQPPTAAPIATSGAIWDAATMVGGPLYDSDPEGCSFPVGPIPRYHVRLALHALLPSPWQAALVVGPCPGGCQLLPYRPFDPAVEAAYALVDCIDCFRRQLERARVVAARLQAARELRDGTALAKKLSELSRLIVAPQPHRSASYAKPTEDDLERLEALPRPLGPVAPSRTPTGVECVEHALYNLGCIQDIFKTMDRSAYLRSMRLPLPPLRYPKNANEAMATLLDVESSGEQLTAALCYLTPAERDKMFRRYVETHPPIAPVDTCTALQALYGPCSAAELWSALAPLKRQDRRRLLIDAANYACGYKAFLHAPDFV